MLKYRPTWDETWMRVADTLAERAKCDNRQVGAVIVTAANRPVAMGYNGPPAGLALPDGQTCSSFCSRAQNGTKEIRYGLSCPSVHAEANALIFADRNEYAGGTMYVTSVCCQDCAKLVANSGVARLVIRITERDMHTDPYGTIDFIRSCGVEVKVLD